MGGTDYGLIVGYSRRVQTKLHVLGKDRAQGSPFNLSDFLSREQSYINYEENILVEEGEKGHGAGNSGPNWAPKRNNGCCIKEGDRVP